MKVKKIGQWIQADKIEHVIQHYDSNPFSQYSTEKLLHIQQYLDQEQAKNQRAFRTSPLMLVLFFTLTVMIVICVTVFIPQLLSFQMKFSWGFVYGYFSLFGVLGVLARFLEKSHKQLMDKTALHEKHKQQISEVLAYRRYENF